ncbi:hypothetical protein TTHERM_01594610, partial (macronuclear) [Tetrahymena thermophila SB210]
ILHIDLRSSQIGDEDVSDLGACLNICNNLQNLTLDLCKNQIGAKGVSDLVIGLANCTNLSNLTLDLHENQINDQGASDLGSCLANCTNLSNLTLDLRSNQICEKGALDLGSGLANCTNLSDLILDLRQNQISAKGASYLSSCLANCTNLLNLTLDLGYKAVDLVQKEKANQTLQPVDNGNKLFDLIRLWWKFEYDQKNINQFNYEKTKQISPQKPTSISINQQKFSVDSKYENKDSCVQQQLIKDDNDSDFKIMNSAFEKGNFNDQYKDQIKNDIKRFTQVKQNINLDLFYNPKDDKSFYIIINDEKRKNYGYLTVLVTEQQYQVIDFLNFEKKDSILQEFSNKTKLLDLIKIWWKFEYLQSNNK